MILFNNSKAMEALENLSELASAATGRLGRANPLELVGTPTFFNREKEKLPGAFVCYAQADAVLLARVLRSELSVRLARDCMMGGGKDAAEMIGESDAFVLLLTKQLLTDVQALFEIWTALELDKAVVTVAATGLGYDFEEAAASLADLTAALEAMRPGSTDELQARLPPSTDINTVGKLLHSSLTAIIAVSWSPTAGRNHMDAVVDDIVQRMPRKRISQVSTRHSWPGSPTTPSKKSGVKRGLKHILEKAKEQSQRENMCGTRAPMNSLADIVKAAQRTSEAAARAPEAERNSFRMDIEHAPSERSE
eukprot:7391771-Prymnesium_polylepis.2